MSKDRNTIEKRQREQEKKRKADQKRERRELKRQKSTDDVETEESSLNASQE